MKSIHRLLTVLSLLVFSPLLASAGGKQSAVPRFPSKDEPARKTAAKYNFSMNMLLYPDYFMTEEQFQESAKDNFKHSNMLNIVNGLRAYEYKAEAPKSAQEYREKVYPLMLDYLKQAGYVAIEVPINGATLPLCPPLKAELNKRGFKRTAVGMTGEDLEASLKPKIDCTHALGATVLAGPVVLPFKQYPENAVGDARVAWTGKRLKELREPMRRVAEYAKSKNVRLAVEPLNRFELPGLNRLQDAIQFVRAVDHPNFGVMIDTCHEISDGEGPGKFAGQVKTLMKMNKLFHVHISAVHRGRIDKGWIQWWGFFVPLRKNGYQGNMSMEIFDATLPFSDVVHVNRKRFENPMEVALSALLFSAGRLQKLEEQAK